MEKNESSFKYIKTIGYGDGDITSLDIFPNGNYISISRKGIVYIWKDLQVIQSYKIENNGNYVIGIKDNKNLVVISDDRVALFWNKEQEFFKVKKELKLIMHDSKIKNVFYYNGNYFMCSDDLITVWEEYIYNNELNYQLQMKIRDQKDFFSSLFIPKKNLFVTGGKLGLKIWNLNNLSLINNPKASEALKSINCKSSSLLKLFDDDSIIVGTPNKKISIINLSSFQINNISFEKECSAICVLMDLFFVSSDLNLYIFNKKTLQKMDIIENASMTKEINDIKEIKKNQLALYAYSGYIRLFSNHL